MPDEKISEMDPKVSLDGTELFVVAWDPGTGLDNFSVSASLLEQGIVTTTPVPAATETTVYSLLTDDFSQVLWELHLRDTQSGESENWTIDASHDGTATSDASDATYTIGGLGPVTGDVLTIKVDVSGSGLTQTMRIRVEITPAGWEARVKVLAKSAMNSSSPESSDSSSTPFESSSSTSSSSST